METNL